MTAPGEALPPRSLNTAFRVAGWIVKERRGPLLPAPNTPAGGVPKSEPVAAVAGVRHHSDLAISSFMISLVPP